MELKYIQIHAGGATIDG